METLINLTPHALNLYAPAIIGSYDGECGVYDPNLDIAPRLLATIPSSGVARVASTPGAVVETHLCFNTSDTTHVLYHFPIAEPLQWLPIEGLPEPQDNVIYVTSTLVAQHARRRDVLSPGTGPNDGAIRDEKNQIVGVTRLVRWA